MTWEAEFPRLLDPHIGRTNVVLHNDQDLFVREHLSHAEIELQSYDRDLSILLARRAHAVDRVSRCRIALAPYKRLPVEITRQIILLSVGIPAQLPLSEDTLDPRLQITQVCAGWRNIAFDTHELWVLTYSDNPVNASTFELANAWWSQCTGSQLSLKMPNARHKSKRSSKFNGNHLLSRMIIPFCSRLNTLEVALKPAVARKMLALPAGSFYALENLALKVGDRYGEPLQGNFTAFSLCPRLAYFRFSSDSFTDPWQLRLTWTSLTTLHLLIDDLSADLLLTALSECTLLTNCFFLGIKDIDADMVKRISARPTPLCLQALTVLHVQFVGPRNHIYFLRALSLPNILAFRTYHSSPVGPPDYTEFIRNTASTLKEFSLREYCDEYEEQVNPRRFNMTEPLIASLQHLLIFKLSPHYSILPPELEGIASGELLPCCVTLHFGIQELEPVLEMLEARYSCTSKDVSRIQWVSLICAEPDPRLQITMNSLKKRGISIVVKPHA